MAGRLAPPCRTTRLHQRPRRPGEISASLKVPLVHDLASLRRFLLDYQKQILLPHELPAIQRAFDHACRHEVRELAEFDRQLANEAALKPFAEASKRIGQTELLKLRPLRDERIVRRYQEAVDRGEANAWHTLVYGLTLALYSMPLRQGLLGYGFQTSRGFIYSAANRCTFPRRLPRAARGTLRQPPGSRRAADRATRGG